MINVTEVCTNISHGIGEHGIYAFVAMLLVACVLMPLMIRMIDDDNNTLKVLAYGVLVCSAIACGYIALILRVV